MSGSATLSSHLSPRSTGILRVAATLLAAAALVAPASTMEADRTLPWRQAGITERQAAAHLLDRLAYGPRPGDVDRLVGMGLETWIDAQLEAALPEPDLEWRLAR
ncbi:MAG: DUF1800 family protein, partial [Thermoanaerobaculia bacterium]|nr:DUF1800 family protein [Thermoanaerobaculia bacterium]